MSPVLVDPAKFVVRAEDLDPDAVFATSGELRGLGVAVAAAADGAAARWSGLAGCYVAPEAERVLGLLGPAVGDGQQVADMFAAVAAHLHLYAVELAMIRPRLVTLEADAQAFRDEVANGVETSVVGEPGWAAAAGVTVLAAATQGWVTVPWYDHEGTCARNDALLGRYARLLSQVQQTVADCADAVNRAVSPLARWMPGTPVYSPQQWLATAQPWGAPGPANRSVLEQVYAGAGDWLEALAPFAGYDPATGRFGLDVRLAAERGMYDAAGSVAVASVTSSLGGRLALNAAGDKVPLSVRAWLARRDTVVRDTASSLIRYDPYDPEGNGWHRWKDEPWRQATVVGIDVATAAVPGGLAADSAKAATGASRAARMAAAARGALDGVVPGASSLFRAPTAAAGETAWATAVHDLRTTATHGGVDPASLLTRLDGTTPPVHHDPRVPRVSDSLTGHPGGQSWLYQDTPPTTHPPTPERPAVRTDPAPGRAADAITTQPIPGLPRTAHEPPQIDAPTRTSDPAAHDPSGPGSAHQGVSGGSNTPPGGSGTATAPHDYPPLSDPDDVARVRPEDPVNADLDHDVRRKNPNTGNLPDGSWEGKNGQHLTPADNAQVQAFAADAVRAADNVTPRLAEAVTRADPDAVLVGLEDRVKFPDSLKGKTSTMVMEEGLTVEEALTRVNDSVRFTVQASSSSYSSVVDSVISDMRVQGMELVRFKNTWGSDGYKGINSTWRDPQTGTLFELQFHTPESFYTKTVTHDIYERLRLPGLADAEVDLLQVENERLFADLQAPPGAAELSHQP